MELKGSYPPFNPRTVGKIAQFWCSGVDVLGLPWDPHTADDHISVSCQLQLLSPIAGEDFGKEEWRVDKSMPLYECLST